MISDRDLLLSVKERRREERLFYTADFAGTAWDNVTKFYGITDRKELYGRLGLLNLNYASPVRKPDAPKFDYGKYFSGIKIPTGVAIGEEGVLNMPTEGLHFTHLISPLRDVYDFEEIKKFPIFKNSV